MIDAVTERTTVPTAPTNSLPLDERRRTIEDIRRLNPTARVEFLADFQTPALKDYLEHLRHAKHKHVKLAGWLQRRTTKLAAARQALRAA